MGITAGNFRQNPTLSVTKDLHFHHETKLSSWLSTTHVDIWGKYSLCIRNMSIDGGEWLLQDMISLPQGRVRDTHY